VANALLQFFVETPQIFLGPHALHRAGALVGEGLQETQLLLVIGPGGIALDGQDADDLLPPADRDMHQRSRTAARVSKSNHLRWGDLRVWPELQLCPLPQDP